MASDQITPEEDVRRLRDEGTLRCEGCDAIYPATAPGRLVTEDGCEICPACAPDLMEDADDAG